MTIFHDSVKQLESEKKPEQKSYKQLARRVWIYWDSRFSLTI